MKQRATCLPSLTRVVHNMFATTQVNLIGLLVVDESAPTAQKKRRPSPQT
jgi:hypothetical protein